MDTEAWVGLPPLPLCNCSVQRKTGNLTHICCSLDSRHPQSVTQMRPGGFWRWWTAVALVNSRGDATNHSFGVFQRRGWVDWPNTQLSEVSAVGWVTPWSHLRSRSTVPSPEVPVVALRHRRALLQTHSSPTARHSLLIEKYAPGTEAEDSPSHIFECTSRSSELSGPLPPQSPWLPAITQAWTRLMKM